MLPNALKATPSPVFTKIISTGSYLPEKILTNDDLSKFVDTSDEWIRSRSGIQSRHIAADGEETSDLAVMAAKRALEGAGLAATDVDLIVVRENTEGLYSGLEHEVVPGVVESLRVVTEAASERIAPVTVRSPTVR